MIQRLLHLALLASAAFALPQGNLPAIDALDRLPVIDECPEVTPGPGLPSLESLNLTSADLCKPPEEFIASLGEVEEEPRLAKRYTPWCGGSSVVTLSNALSCYNYLYALGDTACVVPPSGSRFCTASGWLPAAWYGTSVDGTTTQSTCRDVARGGAWVINNCGMRIPTSPPVDTC
ncbi:hypothetical protein CC1G_11912 [Coprinopsis cinerea okayama7|uniref:Secreted protein n=1 Tax=Coprinopsis cinerea (strain Okayama-7 / 130 / ATCC MYA-4618 / FGSC 9003) TaxID=240176 RepID=A8NDD5_COPC7|nr:hypothetical protein CC1G_11912 [Coprinopsis cinerea okayama7\|eukprot:XP_001832748.1 hypothetical protein CC1G_11912 [Coprinopsis cinerea okayama7\